MAGGEGAQELLGAEAMAAVDAAGAAEVLVGIHALNQARSVVRVVEAVAAGLAKHLPPRTAAVLVADAGSGDGTLEAVQGWVETAPSDPPVRALRLPGNPGRGRAILALLAAAHRLQASACGLVDAGLVGLAPEGVERLLQPVLADAADYVSPAYTHNVAEGTLTTNLLAPLARALYGKRIQQVAGGCAGLSRGLVQRVLEAGWERELVEHGMEICVPAEALASQARVVEACQDQKSMEPGLAPQDLATTMVGTVGPFFRLMERYAAAWPGIRGSAPVPRTGGATTVLAGGGARTDRMVHAFRMGLKDLLPVWEQIMPEDTLGQLYPLGPLAEDEFRFPPDLWARVVLDFAVAYHERRLARDHLLRALTPLHLGRVAAFLLEARAGSPARVPQILEAVGQAFEAGKEGLEARWR